MRLSCDKTDPGYSQWCFTPSIEIFLDGEKIEGCITADEEKGEALVYTKEIPQSTTEIPTEILYGEVVIKGYKEKW